MSHFIDKRLCMKIKCCDLLTNSELSKVHLDVLVKVVLQFIHRKSPKVFMFLLEYAKSDSNGILFDNG